MSSDVVASEAVSPDLLGPDASAQNFLRVLVEPKEKTEIDVVAVHGLNPTNTASHAEATWTKGDKLWLRDFLPDAAPTARILLFGYNANVAFESSTAGVLEQASNLLNRLRTKRRKEKAENRPIVFIAHSLGGIVVKRALITAGQIDRYMPIRKATYGMVFFATPHRGGEHAKLGNIAVKIVRTVYSNPKNSFMEALQEDSMFGDSIVQDFCNMAEEYKIISFYETRPMPGVGIIVDHKSALLGLGSNREYRIALDLDHRSICKFSSHNDDYEQVHDNVGELIEEAIENARGTYPQSLGLGISQSSPNLPQPTASTPALGNAIGSPELTSAFQTTASLGLAGAIGSPEMPSPLPPATLSPPRMDSYHGSIKSEPQADADSLAESLSLSSISRPQSDPEIADSTGESRRSSSTAPSPLALGSQSSARRQVQSPSIFSSAHMNMSDSDGKRFRGYAAEGKLSQVKLMLEQGAPIDNSGIWDGYTALADAALHGQESVVEFLLSKGANPAFHCISMSKKYGSKLNTPLSLAAAKGHIGTVRLLLDAHDYAMSELEGAYKAAQDRNRLDSQRILQAYSGDRLA